MTVVGIDLAVTVVVLELDVTRLCRTLDFVAIRVDICVDFFLALEDAEHLVVVGGTDRMADQEGIIAVETVSHGIGHVVGLFAIITLTEQGNQFVTVHVEHEVALPTEGIPAVAVDVHGIEYNLDTLVRHLTHVVVHRSKAGEVRRGTLNKHVLGSALIDIDATVDAAVQEGEVQTDVEFLHGRPCQIRVRHVGHGHTQVRSITQPGHGIVTIVVGRLLDSCLRCAGSHRTGTVLTPGEAQFQEVEEIEVLNEVLVAEHPGGAGAEEVAPLVTLAECGETVPTEVTGQVVLVGPVVIDTGKVTHSLGFDAAAIGTGEGVGCLGIVDTEGGRGIETGERQIQRVAVGSLTGVTEHYVEMVTAEVLVIGKDLVDVPSEVVGRR